MKIYKFIILIHPFLVCHHPSNAFTLPSSSLSSPTPTQLQSSTLSSSASTNIAATALALSSLSARIKGLRAPQQLSLLHESSSNNDSNNYSRNSEDVNTLFATYMAQRKDKGFMEMNAKTNMNNDNSNSSSDTSSDSSNDKSDGEGGNTSYNLGTGNTNMNKKSDEQSQTTSPEENQKRGIASSIPRIRRFWGGGGSGSSNSDNVVQHIPLTTSSSAAAAASKTTSSESEKITSTQPPNPPSLLIQDEINRINNTYQKATSQMKDKLNELRNQNPNNNYNIADNAEEVLRKVIEEQKMYDINEVKNQRAMESFDEYYQRRMKEQVRIEGGRSGGGNENNVGNGGDGNSSSSNFYNQDPIVKEIVEEATKKQQYRMEQEQQYRDYKRYEEELRQSAKKKAVKIDNSNNNYNYNPTMNNFMVNNDNEDFDKQQLDILKDLLQKRLDRSSQSDFDDEDVYVTDNIEDGIEELQDLIDNKELSADKYKPETLKEWQMYRAIATKLAKKKTDTDIEEDEYNSIFPGFSSGGSEGRILFESLTDDDADEVRKKIEAWKEFQRKEEEMRKEAGLAIKYKLPFEWSDKPEPSEEVSSTLKAKKPFDLQKAEEARSELDQLGLKVLNDLMMKTSDPVRREKLRQEIKALKDSIEARLEAIKNRGPIVIEKKVLPIDINAALGRGSESSLDKKKPDGIGQSIQEENLDKEDDDYVAQGDDDFVDDYFTEIEAVQDEEERPDSEFFRDLEEDLELQGSNSLDVQNTATDGEEISINLGTMEEQKFRSLVARSGVRTVEGQNKLKQDWEDFQRKEQEMREKTGLSGGGNDPDSSFKVKYDVNNIFKDGDIDADLILGTIGKRPSRKNEGSVVNSSGTTSTVISQDRNKNKIKNDYIAEATKIDSSNTVNEKQDNKGMQISTENTNASDEKKETTKVEVRPQQGSLTIGQETDPQKQFLSNALSSFDAKKDNLLEFSILSVAQLNTLMGLKQSVYATGVSPYLARINKPFEEFGAIFMLEGALVDVTGLDYEAWKETAKIYDFQIPTVEDSKYASVHSEDYAIQRVFFWTDDIFAVRKVVETFREKRRQIFLEFLQSKNIESATTSNNVSPELETSISMNSNDDDDVEMDILNIQMIAWQKVARDHGYEAPTIDLVRMVGSVSPDDTVRSIFKWTKDFIVSNNIATSYRKYLKEESSKWMSQRNAMLSSLDKNDSALDTTSSQSKVTPSPLAPTMEDYLRLKMQAWESAAKKHNFEPPTLNQVNIAEFAGPEKSVTDIFKWTNEMEERNAVIISYRQTLKELTQDWIQKTGSQSIQSKYSLSDEDTQQIPLIVLREGVEHWLSSIQDVYVPSIVISNMDEELMDGVLNEAGLSTYFPKEKRISASNRYESASQKMLGAALRAERRPDHCIVFSATPQSAFHAHEVEMKNIALVSPYPYYELTSADMTVRDFRSIGMMNLKNVFSEQVGEEPMQQIQVESPRIQRKTLLKTRFWDDGDR